MALLLNELATALADDEGDLSVIEKNITCLTSDQFLGIYFAYLNSGLFSIE